MPLVSTPPAFSFARSLHRGAPFYVFVSTCIRKRVRCSHRQRLARHSGRAERLVARPRATHPCVRADLSQPTANGGADDRAPWAEPEIAAAELMPSDDRKAFQLVVAGLEGGKVRHQPGRVGEVDRGVGRVSIAVQRAGHSRVRWVRVAREEAAGDQSKAQLLFGC